LKILSAIHLKICGFFDGDGGREETAANRLPCLPATGAWHAPVTANSPAIALRNAAPVKIFLPRLLPFFFGRGCLVAGIELPVQYGVELLL